MGTILVKGFEAFSKGTMGNSGQNLYVSKNGILQKIYHYDINKDGYIDLLFSNGQDMDERPPSYIYQMEGDQFIRRELPACGAYTATIADISGNGYPDLVIANQNNGAISDVCATIFLGTEEGITGKYHFELPAPNAKSVAVGDFDGDGYNEIAFNTDGILRVFHQIEGNFVLGNFTDFYIPYEMLHFTAADIDGDGYCDLYIRTKNSPPIVLWGSASGLSPSRLSFVGAIDKDYEEIIGTTEGRPSFVKGWMPSIIEINNDVYLFRKENNEAVFYKAHNRNLNAAFSIKCPGVVSVFCADIDNDGQPDLVATVCKYESENEESYIFWGTDGFFSFDKKTPLPTISARNADYYRYGGSTYIAICQGKTDTLLTNSSIIYKLTGREVTGSYKVTTHDATRVISLHTPKTSKPQFVFINHEGGRTRADVNAYIYYGSKTGFHSNNRTELPVFSATDCNCCDFNDDGWADVLFCNSADAALHLDQGSFIYYGSKDGFDIKNKTILPTIRCMGAAIGDFRHSGYLDIATVGFYNAELLIFRGTPNGFDTEYPDRIILDPDLPDYKPYIVKTNDGWREFKKDPRARKYQEPRYLFTADFNNDGWLDIFVPLIGGDYSLILWGGPKGFSIENSQKIWTEGAVCANAADFTGNGWLDLVVGSHSCFSKQWPHDSYITIYYGSPSGYSEYRKMQLPAHTANSIAIADYNNDGHLDIFATSYHDGRSRDTDAFIYWGQEGGMFSPTNFTRIFNHSGCGCLAADFNEDGYIDLAVANHKTYGNHQGNSWIYWNGPDGFSNNNKSELPTLGPHGMMPVDPGNIYDRSQEEYYYSEIFKLPGNSRITSVHWEAELPPKTWVKMQLRYGENEEQLKNMPFEGPNGSNSYYQDGDLINNMISGYVQFMLVLGATNAASTPRISSVILNYE